MTTSLNLSGAPGFKVFLVRYGQVYIDLYIIMYASTKVYILKLDDMHG